MTEPEPFSGNCPCLSGEQYTDCCGRFHRRFGGRSHRRAADAFPLLAFVLLHADYLLKTWHPSTRPSELDFDPGLEWRRLDILSAERGGPLDTEGAVEFKAHFRQDGERGVHHETSRFLRVDRRWYYLDAVALYR
jgi:SEC-C motif-containing protein